MRVGHGINWIVRSRSSFCRVVEWTNWTHAQMGRQVSSICCNLFAYKNCSLRRNRIKIGIKLYSVESKKRSRDDNINHRPDNYSPCTWFQVAKYLIFGWFRYLYLSNLQVLELFGLYFWWFAWDISSLVSGLPRGSDIWLWSKLYTIHRRLETMSHGVGPDCAKFICRRSGGREIFSVEPSTDYIWEGCCGGWVRDSRDKVTAPGVQVNWMIDSWYFVFNNFFLILTGFYFLITSPFSSWIAGSRGRVRIVPNLFAAGRVAVKYFLWSRQLTISGRCCGWWERDPRTNESIGRQVLLSVITFFGHKNRNFPWEVIKVDIKMH